MSELTSLAVKSPIIFDWTTGDWQTDISIRRAEKACFGREPLKATNLHTHKNDAVAKTMRWQNHTPHKNAVYEARQKRSRVKYGLRICRSADYTMS